MFDNLEVYTIGELTKSGFRFFHKITRGLSLIAIAEAGFLAFDYAANRVTSVPEQFSKPWDYRERYNSSKSFGMVINALIYSNDLAKHEYTPSHPFKPVRARMMFELLHRYGLISEENQRIIEPPLMDEELLYLFHTREYIELLKKGDKGEFSIEMLHAGLGTDDNPVFKSMYQYALEASSGTYEGAMMLYNGTARFVFNPFGGLHHAGRDYAEGFCYINDTAVAIADLIQKGQKVAYIDVDAHHGNGVQDAFYETDRVLNISIHESGETLYPGTGFETETGPKTV